MPAITELCNCCDTEHAADNAAGYCATCYANAKTHTYCDHA